MATIDIADLTNGSRITVNGEDVWQGTGIFDKLIEVVNTNVNIQYDNNRITSGDYGMVYLGSIQSVIAESMKFLLADQKTEVEIDILKKQLENEGKKGQLYDEQIIKTQEETDLLQSQDLEVQAATSRSNASALVSDALRTAQKEEVEAAIVREDTAATVTNALKTAQKESVEASTTRDDSTAAATNAFKEAQKNEIEYMIANTHPKTIAKLEAETTYIEDQSAESAVKKQLLQQGKDYADVENPKKLSLLDDQIQNAAAKADLADEQLAHFIDSRGKLVKKLDAEVAALNIATNKVLAESAILKSQHTTMEARRPKDLALIDEQLNKLTAETAMVEEQKTQLNNSVTDNKLIRSMQAQSDMLNGVTMAQLQPTADMFREFYKIANTLAYGDANSGNGFDTSGGNTTLDTVS